MANWPGSLPDFTEHRISGGIGEGRGITPTDSAFIQAVVRAPEPYGPVEVSADYTGAQLTTLRNFYFNTIRQVEVFDHIDVFTGAACQYRFHPERPPPSFTHIQAAKDAGPRTGWFWRVSFTLQKLS